MLSRHIALVLAVAVATTLTGVPRGPSPVAAAAGDPTGTAGPLPGVTSGARPGPDILYAPAAAVPQLQNRPDSVWQAEPLLVSGADAYVAGEYLYQGWLHDDHGAAGTPDPGDRHIQQFAFAAKAGTLTYPSDEAFADNAADLVELRIARADSATHIRVTLNTLIEPRSTAFTIALGQSATPIDWPHGAGVRSPAELFLTVHGDQAELVTAVAGTPVAPAPTVEVDEVRNQIEVEIPHAAWDPGLSTVTMRAGVGLWDPEAGSYRTPSAEADATTPGGAAPSGAALFDMAFRFDEPIPDWSRIGLAHTIVDAAVIIQADENCFWRDCAQAEALRIGDVDGFAVDIDFAALAAGRTDRSGVPTSGSMNRILPSRFDFGEGVDYDAACGRFPDRCRGIFRGALQPYTVTIPDGAPPPGGWGLTLLLHASTGNYNEYLGSRHQAQFAAVSGGSVVITPMARDPQGDYTDVAEADVFEVWADVARHQPLDPERTVIGGYSMGAGGTYKLAERWPDLFARAFGAAAIPMDGTESQWMPALRNVPVMVWVGSADEASSPPFQATQMAALDDHGLRYDFWQFHTADHLTLATNDEYGPAAAFLGEGRRDLDPPRISFVADPRADFPAAGLVADHAYWLSDITVRRSADGGVGTIDVSSGGFGLGEPQVRPPLTSRGVLEGGNRGPMPFTRTQVGWAPHEPVAPTDHLRIDATNVAAVTVDVSRARVSCGATLEVTTDGPLRVTAPACGGALDFEAGTSTRTLTDVATPDDGAHLIDFACPARSWVAGTTELCRGVLTYHDYVYDDYGADMATTAESTGSLAVPAGDVRYPEGHPANTADLVDLSLRVTGDRLEVLAEVNALYAEGTTVVAVAIDTDADPATGGGPWPGFGVTSAGWDELHTFTDADPLSNLIGGHVPRPDGDTWRIQAVTAQLDGAAAGVDSDHAVMNVAFRGPDEEATFFLPGLSPTSSGSWFEDRQAAALMEGDISAFGLLVDVADLLGGATRQLDQVGPGLHSRVYTSDVTLPPGEGMSYDGIVGRGSGGPTGLFGQVFFHHGRYQPYGLFLPEGTGPHELGMIYHGSNQNHSGLVNLPGLQQQVGQANNRILASPLARGVHGYGSDISERDLLDVQHDVLASYDIDEESIHAAGYSQGGYVTFRQAALHPDAFAGFTSWVGFTGDAGNPVPTDQVTAGAVGNMFDFVGNYRHVPGAMVYGGADELVHASSSEAMGNQFRQQDFPYVFYTHPTADHFAFALLDEWAKESAYSAGRRRTVDPPRVAFRTAEVLGDVDAGIRHDAAYWVSQIRGRQTVTDPFEAEDAYIDVDLTTAACGGETLLVELVPGAGPAPLPWVSDEHVPAGTVPVPQAHQLTGTLANVASLAVDLGATCLAGGFTYQITSDGPTLLRLSDGRQVELVAGTNEGAVSAGGGADGRRLAGPDRVATAVAVAEDAFTTADVVVLVRSDDYADALGAGPLAAGLDAPLLLTGSGTLDGRVAAEVQRLGAREVVLVGGDAALSEAVEDAVAALGPSVRRIAGEDRFATAAAVAMALVEAGGDGTSVYLVEGANADPARGWPDAVAVGALAARQGRPVLLATSDLLPAATATALAVMDTVEVTVVGGESAITNRTLAMAADPDGDGVGQVALNRIAGADRYETSARVADRTLQDLATTENVWLVTGRGWPDALVAGPAAARSGGVLLLVDGATPDGGGVAVDWFAANAPIERTVVVGGPRALALTDR